MKLVIKKEFRDKITGTLYKVDSEVEFAEARAKELLADPRSLVEAAPEKQEEPEEPKPKKPVEKKPAAKKAKK